MARRLNPADYTVGIVCALHIELAAVQELLDDEDEDHSRNEDDENAYTLGRIGRHNVVLACLPAGQTGTNSAAAVAMQMKSTYGAVRLILMVGIGGGVPNEEIDIRLGDVVVSQPMNGHGGVIQYDFGKSRPSGFERTGYLRSPPQVLLGAVTKLQALHDRGKNTFYTDVAKLSAVDSFSRDQAGDDILYRKEYKHVGGQRCDSCNVEESVRREERRNTHPIVHYGTIASANQVMRDAITRDEISSEFGGVLCFEMEAAGLMNNFPCLVIRGICDYADSHKNKKWQGYAAATAAAYAKQLLTVVTVVGVVKMQTAAEAIKPQTATEAIEPSSTVSYLHFGKNPHFVGRNTELQMLEDTLLVRQDRQKMAIVGLGGIGKTQVALRFAQVVLEKYPDYSVFWVPALSMETFEQALGEIAKLLQIPSAPPNGQTDVKEQVRQHLSKAAAGKWLLIVDNADDMDIVHGTGQTKGLTKYLPESEHGLTVFTSRSLEVAQSLVRNDVVEVEKLEHQEAVRFLQSSIARKRPRPDDNANEDATTKELLVALDYLPLAIIQAAAYINTNKVSLREYVELLKSKEDMVYVLSKEIRDNTRYDQAANAVATTWTISFEQIMRQDPVAAALLQFISCIEWKAIPHSILPAVQPKVHMLDAIGTLRSYSLMTKWDEEDKYDMHRLVHLAIQVWVKENGRAVSVRQSAIRHLARTFPASDYRNRKIWRSYLPHAARLCKDVPMEDAKWRNLLCRKVGQCLYVDGKFNDAISWLEEARSSRSHFGEDYPEKLWIEYELATAYLANGQSAKAIEFFERLITINERRYARDDPGQVDAHHMLAWAYRADGQIKKAVELFEYVNGVRERLLREDHPARLGSQHGLASAYHANGQANKAIELLEYVNEVRERVLGEEHPDRLSSQHALAEAYRASGRVKDAIDLFLYVDRLRERVLGEDHLARLSSQHGLASAYQANGQVKKAIELLEHVDRVKGAMLGEDHVDRLTSQHALAGAYLENGQKQEAIMVLEHINAADKRIFPEYHPDRLASQNALAKAYRANGQTEKADELLQHIAKVDRGVEATGLDRRYSQLSLEGVP